jgi:prepilin-type N-terminal cleavage/methylation domain-containing protein
MAGDGVYSRRMERAHYHLAAQQVAALKAIREKTGITVAESIRRAVDAYLEKEKEKDMKRGFTLIEILVVVIILALLLGILASTVGAKAYRSAAKARTETELAELQLAISEWMDLTDSSMPPQPNCKEDVGMLSDALLMPGPKWWDGVDGTGAYSRVALGDEVGTTTDPLTGEVSIGDGVMDCKIYRGRKIAPLLKTDTKFNQAIDQANQNIWLWYQATIDLRDGQPVLYCPLLNGKVSPNYTPGYVDATGTIRAYPAAYVERKAEKAARYILIHPGPDGVFYTAGGPDDDVTLCGR